LEQLKWDISQQLLKSSDNSTGDANSAPHKLAGRVKYRGRTITLKLQPRIRYNEENPETQPVKVSTSPKKHKYRNLDFRVVVHY
jgi:hypothetical protein